jgi:hypothetical protein
VRRRSDLVARPGEDDQPAARYRITAGGNPSLYSEPSDSPGLGLNGAKLAAEQFGRYSRPCLRSCKGQHLASCAGVSRRRADY